VVGHGFALGERDPHMRVSITQADQDPMSRTLIVIGLMIVAIGVLWPWLSKLGLGRLPGDIVIERDNFTFYAPITTGILISLALSLILWLIHR
jgi:DUF2905 family protein